MSYRASPAQRELIVRLLRGAELDTRTITLQHRAPFQAAGLWCGSYDPGRSVDEFLGYLTSGDASRLIDALKPLQTEAS